MDRCPSTGEVDFPGIGNLFLMVCGMATVFATTFRNDKLVALIVKCLTAILM